METLTHIEKDGIELVVSYPITRVFVPGVTALVKLCSIGLPGEIDSDLLFVAIGRELSGEAETMAKFKAGSPSMALTPNLWEYEIKIKGQYQKVLLINFDLSIKIAKKYNPVLSQAIGDMSPWEYFRELIGYNLESLFSKMEYEDNIKELFRLYEISSDSYSELLDRISNVEDKIEELQAKEGCITRPNAKENSIVYLIGSKEGKLLKIGITGNLKQRMANLQINQPYELHVIKTKPGNANTEKELLERFKTFKLRGEWLNWDDSIIENF